jgi:hypothetical protein
MRAQGHGNKSLSRRYPIRQAAASAQKISPDRQTGIVHARFHTREVLCCAPDFTRERYFCTCTTHTGTRGGRIEYPCARQDWLKKQLHCLPPGSWPTLDQSLVAGAVCGVGVCCERHTTPTLDKRLLCQHLATLANQPVSQASAYMHVLAGGAQAH